ncbi:MAG: hypothetical protein QOK39_1043 [Acidimicrobiaceae bacterium]|nr:hypothetical protein [Acidimicrobiaceae bacterium]
MVTAALALAGCQGRTVPPPPPGPAGPPAIPDAQSAVDAPLFVGQNAFPAPLSRQTTFTPALVSGRADGGNSGTGDGPAPLGRGPVVTSAAIAIAPPLLWGRHGGLTTGCRIDLGAGVIKDCLAAVDASSLTILARWTAPGQDLNVATAIVDDSGRVVVTTRQRHLFVLAPPPDNGSVFRVVRDIDLGSHLADDQGLLAAIADDSGNLWFVSGGPSPTASTSTSMSTTVGYVTAEDVVVTTTLADQRAETVPATDQGNLYLATAPAGAADHARATGFVYGLTAADGRVAKVWQQPYDAGSGIKPGGTNRGTASPVMLLGRQYLVITDNADDQAHLLVFVRGSLPTPGAVTSTSTPSSSSAKTTSTTASALTTTTTPAAPVADPRLVCTAALFSAGDSAVTTAPIGYSAVDAASVIVANGANTPPPLANPTDDGPANNMATMATGLARVDIALDGTGCRTAWTIPLRLKTGPVLSTTTGLVYGYTQDEGRAAAGRYVWYFVAVDYRTGRVMWRQRSGAGGTKNDNRQPLVLGANGVLYQTLPLGLVWMRDVAQRP